VSTERTRFYSHALSPEVFDRSVDRTGPHEAEIAVARLDRPTRDECSYVDTWAMHVELLLAEAVRPSSVGVLHQLGADDVAIERI
jgi:hypothetical protein